MSGQVQRSVVVASLAFEVGADAPSEIHLLPPGPFRSVDNRPTECAAWQLDAGIAARLIALAASRKTDIVVDFEHQSLRSKQNGQRAEAAGWIPRSLVWRDGAGLFGTGVTWVGDTADLIRAKKYRYISSVFLYDADTGEVLEIISAALTNTPALDGLEALADLARTLSVSTNEESEMAGTDIAALTAERDEHKTKSAALAKEVDGLKQQVATLTTERDAQKTKLEALTKERDDATTQLADLKKKQEEAALAADNAKRDELVTAALTDGRLLPAQKEWAGKQSLAALTEYLKATGPVSLASLQADRNKGAGGDHGLTAEELATCKKMGVTPEAFAKAKAGK